MPTSTSLSPARRLSRAFAICGRPSAAEGAITNVIEGRGVTEHHAEIRGRPVDCELARKAVDRREDALILELTDKVPGDARVCIRRMRRPYLTP